MSEYQRPLKIPQETNEQKNQSNDEKELLKKEPSSQNKKIHYPQGYLSRIP